MKKIMSIFAVLAASLMFAAVASAETPVVSIDVTPITAENVAEYADYGVEVLDDYDAYAIDYKLSGLTLERKNTPKLNGDILNGFEVVMSMSDEDFAKVYKDYSMMYIANYNTTQTDVFADNNYTTSINTATVAASYPAKNTSVAATDSNAVFTSVVYIDKGETVTMDLYKLSGNVYTFTNGNGTEKLKFNIENPAAPVVCETTSIVLGEADEPITPPAPTTKTVAFTADLAAVGTGYMFTVTDTTADLTADTAAFDFTTDIAAAESVTVGLIVENVPVDNVLSAVAKLVF